MSLKFIYVIFYVILHTLFAIFDFVYDQWFHLKRKLTDHEVTGKRSLKYVAEEARKFDKIPTHLTLLLGHETHSINDLTNLILWSLTAGISFVSIYDCKGTCQLKGQGQSLLLFVLGQLKKRESELQLAVSDKIKDGQHVIWHGESHTYKNGYSGAKVHVKILTESDGRMNVVNTAKMLANSDLEDIYMDSIDCCLRKQFEFPDPDLGVYCGVNFSLYSYPPWQIRVTEFFNVRTHRHVTAKCFLDLLRRYNKCEQRLGK